jgi:hypothetical protein
MQLLANDRDADTADVFYGVGFGLVSRKSVAELLEERGGSTAMDLAEIIDDSTRHT